MQVLVQWLYTQKLDIRVDKEVDTERLTHLEEPLSLAVSVWALADKLLLPALQNEAVDWIERVCNEAEICPNICVGRVYECTGAGSLLRQFFVSHTAHYMPSHFYKEDSKDYPKEFLVDLAAYFGDNFVARKARESKEDFHVQVRLYPLHIRSKLTTGRNKQQGRK